jgi:hypothetical protein
MGQSIDLEDDKAAPPITDFGLAAQLPGGCAVFAPVVPRSEGVEKINDGS